MALVEVVTGATGAGAGVPRLEVLARRLLELVGRITGLESTYLTMIDWDGGEQQILYSQNTGDLEIPEGLRVEWSDTLCRRALEGGPACTADVAATYPGSAAARDLGIVTYVTVPVEGPDGGVFGTVCGASTRGVEVSEEAQLVMRTLAEMVALQLSHDENLRQLEAKATCPLRRRRPAPCARPCRRRHRTAGRRRVRPRALRR